MRIGLPSRGGPRSFPLRGELRGTYPRRRCLHEHSPGSPQAKEGAREIGEILHFAKRLQPNYARRGPRAVKTVQTDGTAVEAIFELPAFYDAHCDNRPAAAIAASISSLVLNAEALKRMVPDAALPIAR